ncbi:hypothetical protein CEW46_29175 [Bacillus cereus]|nr:hypothetical protein CEW46_29175 [Bacillus cereus]
MSNKEIITMEVLVTDEQFTYKDALEYAPLFTSIKRLMPYRSLDRTLEFCTEMVRGLDASVALGKIMEQYTRTPEDSPSWKDDSGVIIKTSTSTTMYERKYIEGLVEGEYTIFKYKVYKFSLWV